MNWHDIFVPTIPMLEIVLRGSIIYLGIFVMLRLVMARRSEGVSTSDMLFVVFIADAAQNGMAGEYKSVTEGLVLVATIMAWDVAIDAAAYYVPGLGRLIDPPPLLLVANGQLLRRNLRRELISTDELMSMLREQGIDDPAGVRRAYLEPNGKLSVLRR